MAKKLVGIAAPLFCLLVLAGCSGFGGNSSAGKSRDLAASSHQYLVPEAFPSPAGKTAIAMPDSIDGYKRSSDPGDPSKSGELRVFQGSGSSGNAPQIIPNFPSTMNHCADMAWTLRWRSLNPDVAVIAFGTAGFMAKNQPVFEPTEGMPEAATSGYLSGYNCEQPAFKFGEALNGNQSTLTDVVYEWMSWAPTP